MTIEQLRREVMKYRKTALIEAVQWWKMGDHPAVVLKSDRNRYADEGIPWIDTLEGGHIVTPGDWIATGIKGEHWPIKPDVFAATYEPADANKPTFEGDEAEVRRRIGDIFGGRGDGTYDEALEVLAITLGLLDAKDAEIDRLLETLADRDAAIVEAVRRADRYDWSTACFEIVYPLRPFLPAPEPVSDPLDSLIERVAERLKDNPLGTTWHEALREEALAGKIVFEGEGK